MNRFSGVQVILLLISVLLTDTLLASPLHKDPERDSVIHISIGGAMVFSTVNMGIEPLGDLRHGLNGRVAVKFKRRIGLCAEYTYQNSHSALPAWGNINCTNLDLNMHYLYLHVVDSEIKWYGLLGICIQQWSGVYQGTPAFDRDIYDYSTGDLVKFVWPSINVGFGFERFYKQVGLFGEFKFRFGQDYTSDPFEIVDVNLAVGLKINLVTIGDLNKPAPAPHRHSHKMGIKPKMYHWF